MEQITDQGTKAGLNAIAKEQYINKFGENNDIDAAAKETVWTSGGEFVDHIESANTTFYASSTNAADTATITVLYQDEEYNNKTATVTLTGQTQVEIATDMQFVYRAYNESETPFAGTVYIATADAAPGGVPGVATKIKASIDASEQQTTMAVYRVPKGQKALLDQFYFSILRDANQGSQGSFTVVTKQEGLAPRTRIKRGLTSNGTSHIDVKLKRPIVLTEGTYIWVDADVTKDDTAVTAGFSIDLFDEETY